MKVLLTAPPLNGKGGVSAFYRAVTPHLAKYIDLKYLEIGSATRRRLHYVSDQIAFMQACKKNVDLVHINPSLDSKSIIRDGLFLHYAKKKNKKVLVFFHGWDRKFEKKIANSGILRGFLRSTFGKADKIIVLASDFKKKLEEWGIEVPICIGTTAVDDSLVENFDVTEKLNSFINGESIKFLFLARLEREKGVIETLDMYDFLRSKGINAKLIIAGDGPSRKEMLNRIVESQYKKDIEYIGFVEGERKKKLFGKAHIYVFPTTYGEGMPTSVLEAICFGCFVITTDVGGLKDLWKKHKWGMCISSAEIVNNRTRAIRIIYDEFVKIRDNMPSVMHSNWKFGAENFLANKISKRIKSIYESLVSKK